MKRATWSELITAAANKEDWKTVRFLLLGDASSPSPVDCDLSRIQQLTTFIKVCLSFDYLLTVTLIDVFYHIIMQHVIVM